jgi:hypothetical protein
MTGGRQKVPSKTFYFGPVSDDLLLDLFQHHLVLAALLEASASILAPGSDNARLARNAVQRADLAWIHLIRQSQEEDS